MNKQIAITKNNAIYLSLAVVLSISAMVIPMQAAHAQAQTVQFLVRVVGGATQSTLQQITFSNCLALCTITVNDVLSHNVVQIPVNVQVGSVNVPVTVCGVLSSGTTTCTTDQHVSTTQTNIVTLPVRRG
jgi:hypothetical protein